MLPDKRCLSHGMCLYQVMMTLYFLNDVANGKNTGGLKQCKMVPPVNVLNQRFKEPPTYLIKDKIMESNGMQEVESIICAIWADRKSVPWD